MSKLDKKFYGRLTKVKDGSAVPEDQWVVFLVKDNAFAAVLPLYRDKCIELGADTEQVKSVNRMIDAVEAWRRNNPGLCKVPDAAGEKMLP